MAPRARRQRRRHGAGHPRGAAAPARAPGTPPIVNTCSIAATAGLPQRALYSRQQGGGPRADPGDGRRPRRRGDPGQLRQPGHGGHALGGRLLDAADDPAAERAALEARQPHGRLVTPTRSPTPSRTWPRRWPASTTGTWLAVDGGHGPAAAATQGLSDGDDSATGSMTRTAPGRGEAGVPGVCTLPSGPYVLRPDPHDSNTATTRSSCATGSPLLLLRVRRGRSRRRPGGHGGGPADP